jgi:hypothetical protein
MACSARSRVLSSTPRAAARLLELIRRRRFPISFAVVTSVPTWEASETQSGTNRDHDKGWERSRVPGISRRGSSSAASPPPCAISEWENSPSHLHHMVAAGETTSSGTLGSPLPCASTGVRLLASTSHRRISCCWARPSDNGEDVGFRRPVVNCAPRSVGSPPSVVSTFPSPKPPVPVCCFLVPASCT